jgi:hypothetical protein
MSRVLTVLGNVRYFHLMKVSNMVQMVTMVAPLYSVEHHIDSIRIEENVSNTNGKREVMEDTMPRTFEHLVPF